MGLSDCVPEYDYKTPKRVLITGITGMVGSFLADFLLENTD